MIFVITGTSSGLGFELAKILGQYGLVIGLSRKLGKAHLLSASSFKWIKVDFTDEVDVMHDVFKSKLVPEIESNDFKLIINSAMFYAGDERPGFDKDLDIIRVNYLAPKLLIETVAQYGLKRILFVNSISGLIGQADQQEYASSKHALQGYASSLAKEAKNLNYDVMSVNPGGMNTELWDASPEINTSDFICPIVFAELRVSLVILRQRLFIDKMIILPPSDL